MKKYVLRRALIAIPTFFGITVLVFLISSMASGSPLELLLNNQNISAAEVERQRIKPVSYTHLQKDRILKIFAICSFLFEK